MSHKDTPTGQQFCVRYKRDENGREVTYWGHVHDSREEAEEARQDYEHFRTANGRIHDIEVFVRDLSPWRQDTGPEPCGNCRHPKNEHPGGGYPAAGACEWWIR